MIARSHKFRLRIIISVGVVFIAVLSGCLASNAGTDQVTGSNGKEAESAVVSEAPEVAPATATSVPNSPVPSLTQPKSTSTEAATNTPEKSIPTPRSGLEATDPETVELASGQIQLVEFFAFW